MLVGVAGGLRHPARIDPSSGVERLPRQDVVPGLLVERASRILAPPEAGVAVFRSRLRRDSATRVLELAFPGLDGAAPATHWSPRDPQGPVQFDLRSTSREV